MTEPNAQTIRIGELMIKAGFISDQDLAEALEISKDSGQRVGAVFARAAQGWAHHVGRCHNVITSLKKQLVDYRF
jgi:hypothetical protein